MATVMKPWGMVRDQGSRRIDPKRRIDDEGGQRDNGGWERSAGWSRFRRRRRRGGERKRRRRPAKRRSKIGEGHQRAGDSARPHESSRASSQAGHPQGAAVKFANFSLRAIGPRMCSSCF